MGKTCPHPFRNQGSGSEDKAVLFPKKNFDILICVQSRCLYCVQLYRMWQVGSLTCGRSSHRVFHSHWEAGDVGFHSHRMKTSSPFM